MGTYGRYYSPRDMKLVNSFNGELMGDIVQTVVEIHKLAPEETQINMYGESDPNTGKVFFPAVAVTAFVKRETIDTPADEFGTDRKQVVKFAFREEMLKKLNLYPQNGDIIVFNDRLHEIDGVDQEQFPGGVPEKSLSIVCSTHYSRLSRQSMFIRQG